MATGRRVSRVAELIRREVSLMLLHGIKDERVGTGMVSVTRVDVAGDLQHAKIFVSVYGTDEAREMTMDGLRSATNFVRRELGHRVRLRRTPEISFWEDRGIADGTQVMTLINKISREHERSQASAMVLDEGDLNEGDLNEGDLDEGDLDEGDLDLPVPDASEPILLE